MYHQARTCSSPLTASRKDSSLRLPRVGARTFASAIASLGGLRCGPFGSGVGTASLTAVIVGSTADGPGRGTRVRVKQRGAVVLLGLRGSCGVAAATNRFPGAVVELVLAAVGAVGRDSSGVATGLT